MGMNQTTASAAPQPHWQPSAIVPALPPAELEAGKARATAATGVAVALFVLGIGVGITWHWGSSWQQVYDFDIWTKPAKAQAAAVRAPLESGRLAGRSHGLGGGASVHQLDEEPLKPFADFSAGLANGGPIEQEAPRTDLASGADPAPQPEGPARSQPFAQGPRLQPVGFKSSGGGGTGGVSVTIGAAPKAAGPVGAPPAAVPWAGFGAQHSKAAPRRKGRAFGGTHLDDLPKPENPGRTGEYAAGEYNPSQPTSAWGVSPIASDPSQSFAETGLGLHHGPEKAYEAWPEGLREKLGQKNGYGLPASGEAKCKAMTEEAEKAACEAERQDKKEKRAKVRADTAEALGTAGRKW